MRKYRINGEPYDGEEYTHFIDQLETADPLFIDNEDGWVLSICDHGKFYTLLVYKDDDDIYSFNGKSDKNIVMNIARLFISGQLDFIRDDDWTHRRTDWRQGLKNLLVFLGIIAVILIAAFILEFVRAR